MKNKIRIMFVMLFMVILTIPTVMWLFVYDDPVVNFDLGENRNLASFPESFTGNDYPARIDEWYNDNLPFRSVLNTADSKINDRLDAFYEKHFLSRLEAAEQEVQEPDPQPQPEPEQKPPIPAETQTEQGPHVHSYAEAFRIDETCTEPGYSVYTCSCGDSFKTDRPPLGHNYNLQSSIEPTCTEGGISVLVCTRCGDKITEETEALDHDYELTQTGTASCLEDSIVTYTCKRCGYSFSEETKGLGHSWIIEETRNETCTEDGFIKYICENCLEIKEETIPATGHNYQIIDHLDETCMTDGFTVFRCEYCGDTYSETLVHNHILEPVKTVQASYEDYGYVLNRCSRCGAEVRTDIVDRIESTTKKTLKYHNQITIEGRYGWLFYQGDDSEQYYKGTNILTDKQMQNYAEAFSELNEICRKLGKKLVVMIEPNKEQVYPEFYPTVTVSETKKRIQRMVEYVRRTTDVSILYPLEELSEAKPYWQTYFKLDTHWNELGALIGTQCLYKELGIPTTDIRYLPIYSYDRGQGDLVNLGNLKTNQNFVHDTGYVVTYKPEITDIRFDNIAEGLVLGSTTRDAGTNYSLVLISDSFRDAMIPYLTKDFSSTMILHRSNMEDALVRQSILNSDIIVIAAVERYETQLLDVVSKLKSMLGVLLR